MQSPETSQVVLHANALVKCFGRVNAVNEITLEVRSSECLGLLGPNGAGKSTVLSLLCGLLRPDAGSVAVLGEHDPTEASVRRQLGLVPQELALYPELSVLENLTFFGKVSGLTGERLELRTLAALEFSGLEARRHATVRTLSGGMQRRLNLACATLHSPRLLLLDEPTVGVDQLSRAHIYECIQQLKRDGVALVYSTHYLEEVEQLCDRLVIVDHGRIVAEGTPSELLRRHGGQLVLRAKLDRHPSNQEELSSFVDEDGWMRLPCQDVRAGLDRLLAWGVPLGEVHVEKTRLEDVVLSITGRRPRNDG